MDSSVLDLDDCYGAYLVREYLAEHPELAPALARVGARIVVFEVRCAPVPFQTALQEGLDRAIAAVPGDTWPLCVALIDVGDLPRARGRFVPPRPTCSRGSFLGFIGLGEGGGRFVQPDGASGEPSPEAVLAAIVR